MNKKTKIKPLHPTQALEIYKIFKHIKKHFNEEQKRYIYWLLGKELELLNRQ